MAQVPIREMWRRKRELKELLKKKNGNVLKVAKHLKVTPQAVYARMASYDIPRRKLLRGEPTRRSEKKQWLIKLLERYGSPGRVAQYLKVHENTVRNRMTNYNIRFIRPRPHEDKGEPQSFRRRRPWLRQLLEKKGSVRKLAQFLEISESAIYERLRRYNLDVGAILKTA